MVYSSVIAALNVLLYELSHVLWDDGGIAIAALDEELSSLCFYVLRH